MPNPCAHEQGCGCPEVSPCCFTCTLDACRFDDPWGYQVWLRKQRDILIVTEIQRDKLTPPQAAARFGVKERTINRIKARVKETALRLHQVP